MKDLMKLANVIEESRKKLFNQGYSFSDATEMVKLVFEEKGLKMTGMMELERSEVKEMIVHLQNNI